MFRHVPGPRFDQNIFDGHTVRAAIRKAWLINEIKRRLAHTEMEDARGEKAVGVAEAVAACVPYTLGRRQGSPADAILFAAGIQDAAKPTSMPVIVTGCTHHAAHHAIGSVAVQLLHQSPYSVLTIS